MMNQLRHLFGAAPHEPHENHKMSRRQLVLVIAGSIVALLIVAYAGNHSKNKTEERERIADIAPTEQDFDRWGLTCMETLFDLYGELPEPELFAGCVLAHKQGLVP
jgi:hypothetical protein